MEWVGNTFLSHFLLPAIVKRGSAAAAAANAVSLSLSHWQDYESLNTTAQIFISHAKGKEEEKTGLLAL